MGQLIATIMPRIGSALKLATDEMFNELLEIVNSAGWGGSEYATGALRNHWEQIYNGVNGISASSVIQLMSGGLGGSILLWQYGNPYWGTADAESMATWYNEGTGSSGYGFPTVPAYNYWTNFETYVASMFDSIIAKYASAMGL